MSNSYKYLNGSTFTLSLLKEPKSPSEIADVALEILRFAEKMADETSTGFAFSPEYGMGGYYTPVPKMNKDRAIEILQAGGEITAEEREQIVKAIRDNTLESSSWTESHSGWESSSANC